MPRSFTASVTKGWKYKCSSCGKDDGLYSWRRISYVYEGVHHSMPQGFHFSNMHSNVERLKIPRRRHESRIPFIGDQTSAWVESLLVTLEKSEGLNRSSNYSADSGNNQEFSDELQSLCAKNQFSKAMDVLTQMGYLGIMPTESDYHCLFRTCNKRKSLSEVKQVLSHLNKNKFRLTTFLGEYIVITLAKCGALEDAFHLFQNLPSRTVYSWTAMIKSFTESGKSQKALQLYEKMKSESVEANEFTFVSLLKACGSLRNLKAGKDLHEDVKRKGLDTDIFIGSTLVSMYGKCGDIKTAESIFNNLKLRNIVSWNAMLSAYVDQGQEERAVELYKQMKREGAQTKEATFVIALQACSLIAEKEEGIVIDGQKIKDRSFKFGKVLHDDLKIKSFESHPFIGSSLVNMYGKCGAISEVEIVFSQLTERDVVAWTSLLSAYVVQGQGEKVLELYRRMQDEGTEPDEQTLVMALQGCCLLAESEEPSLVNGQTVRVKSLGIGRALHVDAQRKHFDSNVFVASSLVTMYSKCGDILLAENVFSGLSYRDSASWNAMLSAYVDLGKGAHALKLFKQMNDDRASLCDVTLVCVLQACSELGNVDISRQVHFSIISSGCLLNLTLAALIHAYGSCASMTDAQAVFDALDEPDIVTWSTLVAGYCREGTSSECQQKFEDMKLVGMVPDRVTFLSLLSACSHDGLVDEGVMHLGLMRGDYGLPLEAKHFVCLFDLLGRAGDFRRLKDILPKMPKRSDIAVWLCLLASCRTHGNVEVGKFAFDCAVEVQPKEAGAYVLMSNIYADAGMFDSAYQVDLFRQKAGAWESSAEDWLEINPFDEHLMA